MSGLISNFPYDGVVTVNRVILKPGYTVDDLQERVAELCENVKTYHSDTGFVGGFVALNSGQISNEGSTIGQPLEAPDFAVDAAERGADRFRELGCIACHVPPGADPGACVRTRTGAAAYQRGRHENPGQKVRTGNGLKCHWLVPLQISRRLC